MIQTAPSPPILSKPDGSLGMSIAIRGSKTAKARQTGYKPQSHPSEAAIAANGTL
ncbi:hypothetical protein [Leptolyngbya sp. FACHB-711]|uniref:hypothetical protein n=1 Tax=Leptolyngbya sp. FACHB-711 TaxID=2692813 RepID=UPI00168959EE|nr:hypothetical protein [Leptolyngbya sp. FACHB-711]MBD2027085.1 hypothetical protein [Leptolyngbya sp. FACHB-711]